MTAPQMKSGLLNYTPLPKAEEFHRSDAQTRIILGGNRAGTSLAAAAELASACLGIPIQTPNGVIPNKYPNRPLEVWILVYDLDAIARNIHRLLFKKGAFKLPDGTPAEPLIPPDQIDDFVYHDEPNRVIFKDCRLKNGTVIKADSSLAPLPRAGDQYDIVWIDSEIADDTLATEAKMRLIDRGGKFFWSTFPSMMQPSLKAFCNKAPFDPNYHVTHLKMIDNPHLDPKIIEELAKYMTPEEQRQRIHGDFVELAKKPDDFPDLGPVVIINGIEYRRFDKETT